MRKDIFQELIEKILEEDKYLLYSKNRNEFGSGYYDYLLTRLNSGLTLTPEQRECLKYRDYYQD